MSNDIFKFRHDMFRSACLFFISISLALFLDLFANPNVIETKAAFESFRLLYTNAGDVYVTTIYVCHDDANRIENDMASTLIIMCSGVVFYMC